MISKSKTSFLRESKTYQNPHNSLHVESQNNSIAMKSQHNSFAMQSQHLSSSMQSMQQELFQNEEDSSLTFHRVQFSQIRKDIQKIVNQVVDQKLKERNIYLLTKKSIQKEKGQNLKTPMKQNIKIDQNMKLKLSKQKKLTIQDADKNISQSTNGKQINCNSVAKSSYFEFIYNKSINQINQHYCNLISDELVKRIGQLIITKRYTYKTIAHCMLMQDTKHLCNISGLCFWDSTHDGTITISRQVEKMFPKINNNSKESQKLQSTNSLFVATVYLCNYEKNLRSQ